MGKRKSNRKTTKTPSTAAAASVRRASESRKRLIMSVIAIVIAIVAIWVFQLSGKGSPDEASSRSIDRPSREVRAVPSVDETPAGVDAHGPSIYFPEPEFDFGSIAQGAKVSHKFVVQNTGDEPLKLIRAKGG